MPLYGAPTTKAEALAHLLEVNYGLQLDIGRRGTLLTDLESFLMPDAAPQEPVVEPEPAPEVEAAPTEGEPDAARRNGQFSHQLADGEF